MSRPPTRSRFNKLFRVLLLLAVLLAAVWYRNKYGDSSSPPPAADGPVLNDEEPETAVQIDPKPEFSKKRALPPLGQTEAEPARPDGNGLEKLTGCRLIEHRNNDGDSFLVRHGDREFELRLYYVDSAEKYLSDRYEDQRRRVSEQARDFGDISIEDTIALGNAARIFTYELLKGKSFTVYTKWEQVYDGDRYYGFVLLPGDQEDRYLSETLVRNGLVRLHTKGIPAPDGRTYLQFKKHLEKLEAEAKAARRGAWGF
jgi:endonuclease YncB( thermonuclease family)